MERGKGVLSSSTLTDAGTFEASRGANMSGAPSGTVRSGGRAPRQMLGIVSKALTCIDNSILQGPANVIQS